MKTPSVDAMYAAAGWLDCYEPAPDEDASGIEEVRVWLIDLANAKNAKEFRAEVRKEAIKEIAKERGVKPRDVRAALKRMKEMNRR